jgi:hypothetical protein
MLAASSIVDRVKFFVPPSLLFDATALMVILSGFGARRRRLGPGELYDRLAR